MRPRLFLLILSSGLFIVNGLLQCTLEEVTTPGDPTCAATPGPFPGLWRQQQKNCDQIQSKINIKIKNYAPVQRFTGDPSDLPTSCVILRPYPPGGLGDQLYRFAYAYTAARDLNTTLYIVRLQQDEEQHRAFGANDRAFALDNFKLDSSRVQFMDEATFNAIPGWRGFLLDELGPWRPQQLPRDKIVVVTEFWQSDMYFARYEREIRDQYVPRDEISVRVKPHLARLVREIETTESVGVHVRRGDFQAEAVRSHLYRVIQISYQIRAIKLMAHLLNTRRERESSWPEVKFFVFSDDIEWTRQQMANSQLDVAHEHVFVENYGTAEGRTSIDDFQLMRLCKHNIIPNSGFGWWSAWLNSNPGKLVIAPFPRHRLRFYARGPLGRHRMDQYWNYTYPASWITLNPYTGYSDMM